MRRNIAGTLLALLCLAAAHVSGASAAPPPPPLAVQLDIAKHVVVGRVTRIADNAERQDEWLQWGTATIAVEETLKGARAKTLDCLVVTRVEPGYEGARGVRPCRVGDHGIWLIGRGESGMETEACLRLEDKAKVRQLLEMLRKRTWSRPVNGLRAWAAVLEPEHPTEPGSRVSPAIVFAVQNAQKKDLHVPWPFGSGRIDAGATHEGGMVTNIQLAQPRPEAAECTRLAPGEVLYLVPNLRSGTFTNWDIVLRQGSYRVVLSCGNEQSAGRYLSADGEAVPVTAWVGTLEAPAIEVTMSR